MGRSIRFLPIFCFFLSCSGEFNIPPHFPKPKIPKDNRVTLERIQLGEKLFFDKNLSLDSTISCESCHKPDLAFTDGQTRSTGIYGRLGKRNTPSILNAAYLTAVNKDGGVKNLDLQALVPIEDENEMGISILQLSSRLNKDQEYVQMAKRAYGQPINAFVITRALATFVRTLYSGDSKYDRFVLGDSTALTANEKRGKRLFESDRLNCNACHVGFNFTENTFENNGLYDHYEDRGRARITMDSADIGKFRVPSLRNVGVTPPYMHDGSIKSLEEVVTHYEEAGRHPRKRQSDKMKSFQLTPEEQSDLISFLRALTDIAYAKKGGL